MTDQPTPHQGPNDPYQVWSSPHTHPSPQPWGASPAPGPAGEARAGKERRKQRVWPAVLAAGLFGGMVASLATAMVVGADIEPPTPVTSEGTSSTVAPAVAGTPDWAKISDQVRPTVVAIQVSGAEGGGAGSGVVIDDQGRVLTNNHVIDGADEVQIMLMDGRLFSADVVGSDTTTDLAVVKINDAPDDLTPGELGESSQLVVGQPVMAVGNPLGLDSTVTTGIISALERPVVATDTDPANATVTNAIQIDAAINPGNSGGPLFDSSGHVIGINSSIATTSRSAGSVGLGFAIPIDLAKDISAQLIENGAAEHAFLGVTMTDAVATANGVTRMGAKVEQVESGTPAAEAGIKSGDVIVGIDDHVVGSAESLTGFVREYRSGDEVNITLIRDGEEKQLTATLTTRPEAQG